MRTLICSVRLLLIAGVFVAAGAHPALALRAATAGPYRVGVQMQPAVVPVGRAELTVTVTDPAGKPVSGASVRAIAQMPGMAMGAKEQLAAPVGGKPGAYRTQLQFPMAGGYELRLRIDGSSGPATAVIELSTGQDTSVAGGYSPTFILLCLLLLALAAFVIYRLRKTGQRIEWGLVLTRPVIVGLLLLAAGLAIATYAVRHFRREGAMTPLEAQGMEMSTPAPPGVTPVNLATVLRRSIASTVRYTGQAAGFNEQPVYARVTGVTTWMPYYAGDRVRRGQLLARLDTSQSDPAVAERQAALLMAEQAIGVAESERVQAERAVDQARAEVSGKESSVREAEANLSAARQERENAQAELEGARTMVDDARAELQSAQADQEYWEKQIERTEALHSAGVVSGQEYQKDRAEASRVAASLRRAQARVQQVNAEVRSAGTGVRKADAMIRAAQARARQSLAELSASRAQLHSAQAGVSVADRKIRQARAGVAQGRAAVSAATTTRGYSQIRAESNGVITQRLISPGVLVSPGQAILKVAQLSPMRVQANVAEVDLSRIRVGSLVTVTGQGAGSQPVIARVSSVAPSLDPASRTGLVEAIIPNRDQQFLPGSYVVMEVSTGLARRALSVPSVSVQRASTSQGGADAQAYVWVAEASAAPDELTARRTRVRTGISNANYTEILSGLSEGQRVVVRGQDGLTEGTTVVDAERQTESSSDYDMSSRPEGRLPSGGSAKQVATVEITNAGYRPGSILLKPGVPARVTFIRKTDATCGTEILLPDYKIRKPLPLNKPVTVEFTPRNGEFAFTCPMNMLKGKVIAK